MKRIFLISILLGLLLSCQNKKSETYYSLDHKRYYNSEALQNLKEELKNGIAKAANTSPDSVLVEFVHQDTIHRNDSIIIEYKQKIYVGSDIEEQKNASKDFENFTKSLIGKKFFDRNLENFDGSIFKFENNGKPTLVNLWFTTCAPCIEEMPYLNILKDKYDGKVNFLSVTFSDKKSVTKFLSKRDFNFQHIVNAGEFLDSKKMSQYPLNIVLDKNGKVTVVDGNIVLINNEKGEMKPFFEPFDKEFKRLF